jgi:uncharacterized membrane protein YdjX (TVP38/TMEM64 family)
VTEVYRSVTAGSAIARARLRMLCLVVALTGVGLALVTAAALNARDVGDRLDGLGALVGPTVGLLGAAAVVAMVPASLVAGAAGYALGIAGGTVAALVAVTAGAVTCAWLGRWVGTPAASRAFGGRVERLAAWVSRRPLRAVTTARLVPGLPFGATSYALGFTRISLRDVALGTALGFAPRCFAYAALGGSLEDLGSPEARIALAASAALAVAVVVVPRIAIGRDSPVGRRPGEGDF